MPSINSSRDSHRRSAFILSALLVSACLLSFHSAPAAAEGASQSVTVKSDQAKVVPITGNASTVLVGNPLYADVSIQEGMIVIHGRHFGSTNVVVLDQRGNTLADIELHVTRSGSQNVTIYKGGSPWSYMCAPGCESSLQVGDNKDYYELVNSEIGAKFKLSTDASKLNQ